MRYLTSLFLATFALFVVSPVFSAEIPSAPPASHVSDLVNLLSEAEEAAISSDLLDWQRVAKIEAHVVIISQVSDYNASSIEQLATRWFNDWEIDDTATNDGMLLLIALDDREMRIEVGDRYGNRIDRGLKSIIDNTLAPQFRDAQYAEGIQDGISSMRDLTEAYFAPATSTPNVSLRSQPVVNSSNQSVKKTSSSSEDRQDRTTLWQNMLFLAGVASAGGTGLFYALKKPKCPVCETEMVKLDEVEDDQHLTGGQVTEERVGSVNYNVWECPHCGELKVNQRATLFSSINQCPQCHYKTGYSQTDIIEQATTTSTGLKQVQVACHHCTYRTEYSRTIPMEVDDDDDWDSGSSSSDNFSSGGSFGSGGSSSGGGASGSW